MSPSRSGAAKSSGPNSFVRPSSACNRPGFRTLPGTLRGPSAVRGAALARGSGGRLSGAARDTGSSICMGITIGLGPAADAAEAASTFNLGRATAAAAAPAPSKPERIRTSAMTLSATPPRTNQRRRSRAGSSSSRASSSRSESPTTPLPLTAPRVDVRAGSRTNGWGVPTTSLPVEGGGANQPCSAISASSSRSARALAMGARRRGCETAMSLSGRCTSPRVLRGRSCRVFAGGGGTRESVCLTGAR